MTEYIELNLVKQTATREGITDHVVMQRTPEGNFTVQTGTIGVRVGLSKPRLTKKPGEMWELTLQGYLAKGYIPVPGRNAPPEKKKIGSPVTSGKKEYQPEPDPDAQILVDMLRALAKKAVEKHFSENVLLDLPSGEQLEEGKRLLKDLEEHYADYDRTEFNKVMCRYFAIMPRRMKYLADNLASGKAKNGRRLPEEEFKLEKARLVAAEKDRFDILMSLIDDKTPEMQAVLRTVTEEKGIEVRAVTKEEEKQIRKKMDENAGKYLRAWRIVNKKTEKAFDAFCRKEHLTEEKGIDHLFHGSRGENFWSIITNGLTINPLNVVITGKAYGQGTYFAPDSRKSLGYTDRSGSKWANGSSATGLLGIYKVATGVRYNGSQGCDSSLNWAKLQKICPGAHCTWAEHGFSGFCMDEVIVYNDNQSTIEYLVEVRA